MTWNREELKDDIEILFGKEQLELLLPCLGTIEDKKFYATYHCNEVERLINEELKGLEPDNHKLLNLREGTEEHKKAVLVIKKAHAHIIACLQSLHSLTDVLAHVIYFALNMDNDTKTKIKAWNVSALSVLQRLNLVVGTESLENKFDSLTKDDEFKYLSAIVNCSKHRNLIIPNFWINLDLNKEYSAKSLEFYAFEFNKDNYAKKRVIEFIKNEYSRIDNLVDEIGMEINKYVNNKLILTKGSHKPS